MRIKQTTVAARKPGMSKSCFLTCLGQNTIHWNYFWASA